MKTIGTVITTLVYLAAIIVSGLMFGMKAAVLLVIACCCTAIGVGLIDDADYDFPKPKHNSCVGCKNHLGGGHCRINLEGECREGGGFELWEVGNGNA